MAEIMLYPRLDLLIRHLVQSLCSGIVLCVVLLSLVDVGLAQNWVQGSIESLRPGSSQLSDVKVRFGEPDETAKLWSWEKFVTREGLLSYQSVDAKQYEEGGKGIRSTFGLTYSKLGLVCTLLDRPWELNEIDITNPDVVVHGLRVGDSLRHAKRVLTKKYFDWWSTDKLDIWWLDNQEGIRVAFQRDPGSPRYPMKLISRPRIVKIAIYDKNSSFSGTASSTRLLEMKIGYCRVSTSEQNLDLQERALWEAGVSRVFSYKVSEVNRGQACDIAILGQFRRLTANVAPADTKTSIENHQMKIAESQA